MRKIYRKIAKEYGITMQEVKSEMQSAINAAYQSNPDGVDRIPRKEKIPTPEEVIRYAAGEIKSKR